jgi:rhodanese-related sulfurtransferase
VAQALAEHGWDEARPLIGGYDAWRQAGYSVEPK